MGLPQSNPQTHYIASDIGRSVVALDEHIKGDSKTALTQSGCAISGVVKNSEKVFSLISSL